MKPTDDMSKIMLETKIININQLVKQYKLCNDYIQYINGLDDLTEKKLFRIRKRLAKSYTIYNELVNLLGDLNLYAE